MAKATRVNHIAILVDDAEKSLNFWRDVLGMQVSHVEQIPAEESKVFFLPIGDVTIELVQPDSADSSLTRFLEKRGPGMHHICLEVDDLLGMLDRFRGKGIHVINEVPLVGLDGVMYVFIHPKSTNGVLVELYELPE
jgi:methylmalonyl-CoA epimerase